MRAGKIRWVLTDGSGGGMTRDGRTGSSTVMAAVAQSCTPVSGASSSSTTTSGLYDCQGKADALAALAGERVPAAAEGPAGRRPLRPPYHPPR